MTKEQLGVIKDVGVGLYDRNNPVLWFEIDTGNGCSFQFFEWEKAGKIIKDFGVKDVKNMNGKTCWVEIENGLMKYKRASKI